MDGTTARRMAEQLGGRLPALTVEQLKVRLQTGSVTVDERTVIFVDEASKLDTGHWGELARAVEHHGARIRAIGHDGQHEAIRLSGLFSEMLHQARIPRAELRQIRRHRNPENPADVHPWLPDYQVAVDEGRGVDAVAVLQAHQAISLYDTRAQAMGGIVEEWDRWRGAHEPTESALIIHGPNSDVDLVNELAQQKRRDAGELGDDAVRAVDRDYVLRPGDVVALRNAAYTFDTEPGRTRAKRVENGQIGIVDSVDPKRDSLTLSLREPGAEPRLVEIDQAWLRAQHATGRRAAAVRLSYAIHSFPAQGATVHGTATLAGHWSQAKRETYVGDTRAVYRHSVHVAREDLGVDGTDDDRMSRYAGRISENRQRQASIRSELNPNLQLSVRLPHPQPAAGQTAEVNCTPPGGTRPVGAAVPHASPEVGSARRQPRAAQHQIEGVLAEPPKRLNRPPGPRPEERIARERCEREARRLEALRTQAQNSPDVPQAHPRSPDLSALRRGPASPAPAPVPHGATVIAR
jgi:ATP-dependent exoDNAse (exonuclease V) alpha subunit